MTLDFLTPKELVDLTDRTRADAQIRCLEELGIPYVPSGKGKPKVLRSIALARFKQKTETEPTVLP